MRLAPRPPNPYPPPTCPADCTLDGNVIVTDQKDSFWEWPPPPYGITEVPGVYFFLPLLCCGQVFFFFFKLSRTRFFFFLPTWVKFFFFLLCVGQVFFYFTFEWVKFFFLTKTSCTPPPPKSNGASLNTVFSTPKVRKSVCIFSEVKSTWRWWKIRCVTDGHAG